MATDEQLSILSIDGYEIHKVKLSFSGSVTLNPLNPDDRKFLEHVRAGKACALLVRGGVEAGGYKLKGGAMHTAPKFEVGHAVGPDGFSAVLVGEIDDIWERLLRAGSHDSVDHGLESAEPLPDPPSELPGPADGTLQWVKDDAGDGMGGQYHLHKGDRGVWHAMVRLPSQTVMVPLVDVWGDAPETRTKASARKAAQAHLAWRMTLPPFDPVAEEGERPDDAVPGEQIPTACGTCDGSGFVKDEDAGVDVGCPACDGTGVIPPAADATNEQED